MTTLFDPLEAYRADLSNADRSAAFGDRDEVWLAWAATLYRASTMHLGDRNSYLRRAVPKLPWPTFHEGLGREPSRASVLALRPEATVAAAIAVSEEAEEAGAYATATVVLDLAQLALVPAEPLLSGRLLTRRARILRRLGNLEAAAESYGEVGRLGTEVGSDELRGRADVGMAIVARMRGNYPESRRLFERVLSVPATSWEMRQLHGLAHYGLLIAAAAARDFDAALRHGWDAFRAPPTTRFQREEVLANLSSVCLDSGQPRAALNGYLRAMATNLPKRARLTVVGGAAVAAAQLDDAELVARLSQTGTALIDDATNQYEAADLERALGQAWFVVGDARAGSRFRRRAMTRAQRGGYFEILHEAELLGEHADLTPPTLALSPEALHVTHELEVGGGDTETLAAAAISHPG